MASRFDIAARKISSEPLWVMVGGRPCPKELDNCSQTVYQDAWSLQFDYGYFGGPAFKECQECKNG
jgi:hypothetical protein